MHSEVVSCTRPPAFTQAYECRLPVLDHPSGHPYCHNEYDVTGTICVADPTAVREEICKILASRYTATSSAIITRAVDDLVMLYRGDFPGYHRCETPYHDRQHALEVALATARLLDGYEQSHPRSERLGTRRWTIALIAALFHDSGYIRRRHDSRHRHGAEYMRQHVARSARFLAHYLLILGLGSAVATANAVVHFTRHDLPPKRIRTADPKDRTLGYLLGTADLITQISDRCYLEKLYYRLHPEFVIGEQAYSHGNDIAEKATYASAENFLYQSVRFYREIALKRLDIDLNRAYEYAAIHFGGQNCYLEGMQDNFQRLRQLTDSGDLSQLRPCRS